MLSRLGGFAVRRRRLVLVGVVVFFAVAGAVGGGVAEHLSNGGFEDPAAESTRVKAVVEGEFRSGDPNLVLLVSARAGDVDSPAVAAAGQALTSRLRTSAGIAQATSYWSLGSPPPLKSRDGRAALVLARIAGSQNEVRDRVDELSPELQATDGAVSVEVGGFAEVFREMGVTIEDDLAKAESVAVPITMLLLVVVFGSVVAAGCRC